MADGWRLWDFSPERFSSQEFWNCFDRIQEEQLVVGVWKQKQLVAAACWRTTSLSPSCLLTASTNIRPSVVPAALQSCLIHNRVSEVARPWLCCGMRLSRYVARPGLPEDFAVTRIRRLPNDPRATFAASSAQHWTE
jgi:hypothetical protein